MGTVIKVQCLYERPFWREEGLTGQAPSDTGAVRITFDNSPAEARRASCSASSRARRGVAGGSAAWRNAAPRCWTVSARYFGEQAAHPTSMSSTRGRRRSTTRGCYAGLLPPGVSTTYGEALRAPIGRLHWAGTETATEWNGYMDGALQSGERAAAEVLAALGIRLAWATRRSGSRGGKAMATREELREALDDYVDARPKRTSACERR